MLFRRSGASFSIDLRISILAGNRNSITFQLPDFAANIYCKAHCCSSNGQHQEKRVGKWTQSPHGLSIDISNGACLWRSTPLVHSTDSVTQSVSFRQLEAPTPTAQGQSQSVTAVSLLVFFCVLTKVVPSLLTRVKDSQVDVQAWPQTQQYWFNNMSLCLPSSFWTCPWWGWAPWWLQQQQQKWSTPVFCKQLTAPSPKTHSQHTLNLYKGLRIPLQFTN